MHMKFQILIHAFADWISVVYVWCLNSLVHKKTAQRRFRGVYDVLETG
jgi:hypothetical protein